MTDADRIEIEILILENALESAKDNVARMERRFELARQDLLDAHSSQRIVQNSVEQLRSTYLKRVPL